MYRILISDPLNAAGLEILRESGAKVELLSAQDKPKLTELLPDFDALVVRSGTTVTADVLRAGKRLKVVGRAGVGVDNVDVAAATEYGIVVMNAPGGNTVTTAEHAVSLMLSLARNIPQATASMREGRWEKQLLTGVEITGKTLGIIGLGHIGLGTL